MPLSNYSELQTAVANWMARNDLAGDPIKDFIRLCEAELKRKIDDLRTEARVTIATVGGTATISLPSDYNGVRELYYDTAQRRYPLSLKTPFELDSYGYPSLTGVPKFYTIERDVIRFSPIPDSVYNISLLYFQTLPSLTDAAPTNWLLTQSPDIYLYGSLVQAEGYIKNDARMATWRTLYENAVNQLMEQSDRRRYSGTPLVPNVGFQVI